jgi:NitT/TauT family transport system permease protein/taurine transport system permease protein
MSLADPARTGTRADRPPQRAFAATRWRLRAAAEYTAPFLVLVLVWQAVAGAALVPPNFLPPPGDVLRALGELAVDGRLARNTADSLVRLFWGVAAGGVSGILLGLVVGLHRPTALVLDPVFSFFNALSGIAWIPLALVWFGIGPQSVTFIMWNAVFFLVLYNTMLGVRAIPLVFVQAVRTLGGSRLRVVRDVVLPGALPNIAIGLRMGITFGWRALIGAEMIGATSGLGFMIFDAGTVHRTDIILAGMLVIGAIWLTTHHWLLAPFERWTIERWGLVRTVR